jgi:hypothetical protein
MTQRPSGRCGQGMKDNDTSTKMLVSALIMATRVNEANATKNAFIRIFAAILEANWARDHRQNTGAIPGAQTAPSGRVPPLLPWR